MSEEPVLLAIDADTALARITLNRPERLNSFNGAMHEALAAALDALERADPPVRALLLSGAGRGFCAGQDLADRAVAPGGEPPDLAHSLETRYNPLVRRLRALPMPIVCAVNGVAAGAGANIALACDIVVAARSASFVQPFCKLGLVPDSGGTWLLPRAVGTPRAMALAMLGERIDAERAKAWGMIWDCVDDAELGAHAEALAVHLASRPTAGLARMKRAIHAAAGHTLDEQLDLERDLQREAGRSDDYREGVAAFMEKRTPRFTGR